jgi:hypothetical protein
MNPPLRFLPEADTALVPVAHLKTAPAAFDPYSPGVRTA